MYEWNLDPSADYPGIGFERSRISQFFVLKLIREDLYAIDSFGVKLTEFDIVFVADEVDGWSSGF